MRAIRCLLLTGMLLVVLAPFVQAEQRPINLTIFNPVQLFKETDDVSGLRLNLLYGRNANMGGIDLGFGAGHATGDFTGVQWHVVASLVDGDFTGWQHAFFSRTRGEFYGVQISAINVCESRTEGVQFGFFNMTEDMHGLQIGIVNLTERMYGLQIGLLNIIKQKDKLPILPIVNWTF
jgi:hypothetical protein